MHHDADAYGLAQELANTGKVPVPLVGRDLGDEQPDTGGPPDATPAFYCRFRKYLGKPGAGPECGFQCDECKGGPVLRGPS